MPVDLMEDGILWMINTTAFHPHGYALGICEGQLVLLGDGKEPWVFSNEVAEEKFKAFNDMLNRKNNGN